MDAVEFIDEGNIDIPQWQKDKVLAVKNMVEQDPSLLIDWKTVKKNTSKR